jgi:hypothetical protein
MESIMRVGSRLWRGIDAPAAAPPLRRRAFELEKAASIANHASTRTTQLYDRRRDEMSLDEVERVVI